MSELMEKMKQFGADTTGILSRFLDNEALYAACMQVFRQDPNYAALGAAIEQSDYATALDYAYTLKGVVANLGLTPLFDILERIILALRMHTYDDLAAQYALLRGEMERLDAIL